MPSELKGQRILAVISGTELFGSERANLEVVVTNLAYGRYFSCCARQPALFKPFQFFGHDMTLMHLDLAIVQYTDNCLAG